MGVSILTWRLRWSGGASLSPLLLAALLAGGTGGGGQLITYDVFSEFGDPEATANETFVQASLDRVWEVLPLVYQEMGYPSAPLRGAAERVVTTPILRVHGRLYEGERNSDYLSCGASLTGDRADTYRIQFTMGTRIRAGRDGGTLVETILRGLARDPVTGVGPVQCRGTGRLAREVVLRLQLKLRAPAQ
jgi:hypothetical protein